MITTKLHVDVSWMHRIAPGLLRFHKVRQDIYNCRCPICGDSKKDTRKARFFFYVKASVLKTACHNCGHSSSFYSYMKNHRPDLFEEYKKETLLDSFRSRRAPTNEYVEQKVITRTSTDLSIAELKSITVPVTSLDKNHPALVYLKSRSFGIRELNRLYWTDQFDVLAKRINPSAGEKLRSEGRIVIPFITPDGVVDMVQGRSLVPDDKMKYLSIKAHDDVTKLFGMYELDEVETSYCVEGPLDALFVDNCLATCDANLMRSPADVLIWDCQARNRDVLRYMEQAIEAGRSLVIWPFSPAHKLDINDMIKAGVQRVQLMRMIKDRTFKGLSAKARFMEWKRG